ncbi:hypothetical protein T439DRAFT_321363 [Meredithblackwellia eburnea MCA 4105]
MSHEEEWGTGTHALDPLFGSLVPVNHMEFRLLCTKSIEEGISADTSATSLEQIQIAELLKWIQLSKTCFEWFYYRSPIPKDEKGHLESDRILAMLTRVGCLFLELVPPSTGSHKSTAFRCLAHKNPSFFGFTNGGHGHGFSVQLAIDQGWKCVWDACLTIKDVIRTQSGHKYYTFSDFLQAHRGIWAPQEHLARSRLERSLAVTCHVSKLSLRQRRIYYPSYFKHWVASEE